jgi:hypothetical protein
MFQYCTLLIGLRCRDPAANRDLYANELHFLDISMVNFGRDHSRGVVTVTFAPHRSHL